MPSPVLVILVAVGAVVVGFVEFGVLSFAYERIGVSAGWMVTILAAALVGSGLDIPVAVVPARIIRMEVPVRVFGLVYRVPALVRERGTVVAVNVGGALVPVAVSAYLVLAADVGLAAIMATAAVTVVVFAVARPVPGLGIVTPALVPPAVAALSAVVLGGPHVAAVAFVGGTIGTLLGADILTLPRVRELGAPIVSIGGAGTFDGIFLAGVLAVLLASL